MPTLKNAILPGLSLWLGLLMAVAAQAGPAPGSEHASKPGPPPENWGKDKGPDDRGPGDRGPGRRGGRDRDPFRHLSEEQRKKVREAFEKVWARPEVIEAREKLRMANDEYRKVMHEALAKVDPEVAELLEKNRPKPPPWPEVSDPEFAAKVIERLQSGPGRGEDDGRRHEKLLQHPAVAELIAQLRKATPEQRMALAEQLREIYFRQLREMDREARDRDGKATESKD